MKLAIGTYTRIEGHVDGHAKGIYLAEFNSEDGTVTITDTLKGVINPSYLHVESQGKIIYCVSEISHDSLGGEICSFHLNNEGIWEEKSRQHTSGSYPCYITLDASQKHLLVSNYMGSVSIYQVSADGSISNNQQVLEFPPIDKMNDRQDAPHLHMSIQVPGTDIHLFADLGSNKLWHYELSDKVFRSIGNTELDDGAGPRHMVFSKDGQYLYVMNELNHTVDVFKAQSFSNPLERVQTISVKPGDLHSAETTSAAIHLHPEGRFLYTSTRSRVTLNDNYISVFELDQETGTANKIQNKRTGGFVPRDFIISPDGRYILCAHQDSDNIISFPIDGKSGRIGKKESELTISTPVCLKFF